VLSSSVRFPVGVRRISAPGDWVSRSPFSATSRTSRSLPSNAISEMFVKPDAYRAGLCPGTMRQTRALPTSKGEAGELADVESSVGSDYHAGRDGLDGECFCFLRENAGGDVFYLGGKHGEHGDHALRAQPEEIVPGGVRYGVASAVRGHGVRVAIERWVASCGARPGAVVGVVRSFIRAEVREDAVHHRASPGRDEVTKRGAVRSEAGASGRADTAVPEQDVILARAHYHGGRPLRVRAGDRRGGRQTTHQPCLRAVGDTRNRAGQPDAGLRAR